MKTLWTWIVAIGLAAAVPAAADDNHVTVYNQDLGLIKQVRTVSVRQSEMPLRFTDVAARLIPTLNGGGYILGDKQYDSNPLHDVALHCGFQVVAQRKRPLGGLGHRRHSPGRLRSIALLQNDFGKALYRCRADIERQFGWLTNHAAGLSPLPNWVRRLSRVQSWVQAKLIIHGLYVHLTRAPPLADA